MNDDDVIDIDELMLTLNQAVRIVNEADDDEKGLTEKEIMWKRLKQPYGRKIRHVDVGSLTMAQVQVLMEQATKDVS